MLWLIFVILLGVWLLGWAAGAFGSLIHLLLLVAVAVAVIRVIQGRRAD